MTTAIYFPQFGKQKLPNNDGGNSDNVGDDRGRMDFDFHTNSNFNWISIFALY